MTEENKNVLAHRYPALAIKNKNNEEIELQLDGESDLKKEEGDEKVSKDKENK